MAKESFKDKDPLDVSLYLKDNGIKEDICEIFEGKQFIYFLFTDASYCLVYAHLATLYISTKRHHCGPFKENIHSQKEQYS